MVPGCLQVHICLAYPNFSFLKFSFPVTAAGTLSVLLKENSFQRLRFSPQEKSTATANWHIWVISKVVSSNFAAVNTALWFSPGSTSSNTSPCEKVTIEMSNLPAHIFFILNHLFKSEHWQAALCVPVFLLKVRRN